MVATDDGQVNPYQPPESVPYLPISGERFACPGCNTKLPFLRLWLMQPMGRCPYCGIRLVVRRRGLHKLWMPGLSTVAGLFSFGLVASFGVRALISLPIVIVLAASLDGIIAYKIGYFDRPKWIF